MRVRCDKRARNYLLKVHLFTLEIKRITMYSVYVLKFRNIWQWNQVFSCESSAKAYAAELNSKGVKTKVLRERVI